MNYTQQTYSFYSYEEPSWQSQTFIYLYIHIYTRRLYSLDSSVHKSFIATVL